MIPMVLKPQAKWLRNSNNQKDGVPHPPEPKSVSAAGCSGTLPPALTGLGQSPLSRHAHAERAVAGLKPLADTDVSEHQTLSLPLCSPMPRALYMTASRRSSLGRFSDSQARATAYGRNMAVAGGSSAKIPRFREWQGLPARR